MNTGLDNTTTTRSNWQGHEQCQYRCGVSHLLSVGNGQVANIFASASFLWSAKISTSGQMYAHIAVSWKPLKRGSAIFCANRHTQHTEWPLLPLRQLFDHLKTSIFINSSQNNGGPSLQRMPWDSWSDKKKKMMMVMMMMMIRIQLYITAMWLLVGQASRKTLAAGSVKPGTHYPHVTWAHVMLRVQLGYLTLSSGAHSHFCHSAYFTWSDVELWSAHMPARLLKFCWRTHFVRRDVRHGFTSLPSEGK
jgi:hypothetical protein